MSPEMEKKVEEIEALCRSKGLDPFPICWEEVPRETIWNVASYGLPTRMAHWSFGRSFRHQKMSAEMGQGKIYELILNNNPSYAFLDDTNTDVANLLIVAHCFAHSDFFKNNVCFQKSNRRMINAAESNARAIDALKAKYGEEVVEDWMDIGFALDRHIDPVLGEDRRLYPEPEVIYKTTPALPYANLHGETDQPSIKEEVINTDLPPHPEKDLLWFLVNYSQNLFPWQKEVLSIIRSESFYFYPQMLTKIMNEGWASFWHAEILYEYIGINSDEYVEFAKLNCGVVNPGHPGSINPYYVGFKIFTDIKSRWDAAYAAGKNNEEFQKSTEIERFDEKNNIVFSKLTGYQKMFRVREDDDDVSFIFNYLTEELASDMKMLTYGQAQKVQNPAEDDIIIKSREIDNVRSAMTKRLANYGAPLIYVKNVQDGILHLQHDKNDGSPLEPVYCKETLKYIFKVWRKPVVLKTFDRYNQEVIHRFDEKGSSTETADKYGKEIDLKM